ncbi:TonB-dependent receptor [Tamlana sp. s12]|uniref:TonB-dependent receptor n=1 Tax=Tamlana sp. s12 TaxID=1630406 RepID=UPI000838CD36|nr:TonB-dependent receptor [Tamlana sp. s12]QQY81744.1 TonB-dependent receptor [Tamlana sp. s12]
MRRINMVLLSLLLSHFGWSQEASIKGNIIDHNTKKPISEALVTIVNAKVNLETNALGEFEFKSDMPQGTITLSIEKPGYRSRKFDIEIKEGQHAHIENINLYTKQKSDKLKPVTGTAITGIVTHKETQHPIPGARVSIVDSYVTTTTDDEGRFILSHHVPEGPVMLKITKADFTTKTYPFFVSLGKIAHVDGITLGGELFQLQNQIINTFAEDQLHTDYNTLTNNSSFYQASNATFLRTAAYQFGSAFFKARAQDYSESNVMINGVPYNAPLSGATDWNALSGISETLENNKLDYGLSFSKYQVNGNLGTLNTNTRASAQREGGQIAYLSSSQRYRHGILASYATGISSKGFSLAISASKRTAFDSGYFDGTDYDSNAFLISAETRLNSNNIINFSGFFNSTNRGGRSANTNEVFELKNHKYNSYWGTLNGEDVNARTQTVSNPFLMLNYYLNWGAYVKIQTNIAYNFGSSTRSMIDFQGVELDNSGQMTDPIGENPDPSYYTKLPSYFLADAQNPDYEDAYLAQEAFKNNGQIDWTNLFDTNINSGLTSAAYALYNHVVDHAKFDINNIAEIKLNSKFDLNTAIGYSHFESSHYAQMDNLLGAQNYLDVNTLDGDGDSAQSNLLTPNIMVSNNDIFRYQYDLNRSAINGSVQLRYTNEPLQMFLGIQLNHSNQYRVGKYQNGRSPNLSYGAGRHYSFLDFSFKGGFDYQINPKHQLGIRALFGRQAPTLNNIFLNPFESDNPRDFQNVSTASELDQAPELIPIQAAHNFSTELNYSYQSTSFEATITGYFTSQTKGISNKRFVGDSIDGQASSTIQEVMSDIDKRYMGLEIGASYEFFDGLKLKTAVALGDFVYTNNPELHYVISESEVINLGQVALQNYHLSNTPSQVYSIGFEYRDKHQYWFEVTGNYFANHYIDINPYYRTEDFFRDTNGTVFPNYQPEYARYLLQQDRLNNYLNINLFGGKYWKIKADIIGFKAGINNVLGQNYDVAGFETPGQLKYDALLEDATRKKPLYGNRFWKGYGATYFLNLYYRF